MALLEELDGSKRQQIVSNDIVAWAGSLSETLPTPLIWEEVVILAEIAGEEERRFALGHLRRGANSNSGLSMWDFCQTLDDPANVYLKFFPQRPTAEDIAAFIKESRFGEFFDEDTYFDKRYFRNGRWVVEE